MALGGGTFAGMNKVLPGSYINFISAAKAHSTDGNRGVVAVPLELDWGNDTDIFTVHSRDVERNSLHTFGYPYNHEALKPVRELLNKANTVHIYRLNKGEKAKVTEGSLTATAKYSGVRGNDLIVKVSATADDATLFEVTTYLDMLLVDQQFAKKIEELEDNNFVSFAGTGDLVASEGLPLVGGTNKGTLQGEDYQNFLNKVEAYNFNVLACPSVTESIIDLFVAFTTRMRDENGIKFQTVVYKKKADYEGVITVDNKVIGESNLGSLVYWTSGAAAWCPLQSSLTNMLYDGEYDVDVAYTQTQLAEGIEKGLFMFHKVGTETRVLEDINSFVTVKEDKNEDFSSNQVVRVIDELSNTTGGIFKNKYLGKVQNNPSGRASFWNELVTYMKELEKKGAIEGFNASEVKVEQGDDKKSIVVTNPVTPVSAMNKLYMTIVVK